MSTTRNELIRVRVTSDELSALRARAERDGLKLSSWLRYLGLRPEHERVVVDLPDGVQLASSPGHFKPDPKSSGARGTRA